VVKKRIFLLIFFLCLLGNYWLWHTLQTSLFLGLLGVFLSIIIFELKDNLTKRLVVSLVSLVFIVLFFLQANPNFIFDFNDLEIYTINQRRSYYPAPLGQLFENKPVYFFSKWEKNVFESLDLNNYFFAGHPRERLGVSEFKKFPFIYLPILLIGFFQTIKKRHTFIFLYPIGSIFIISVFEVAGDSLFILFPWFVVVLSEGFNTSLNFLASRLDYVKI